MDEVRIPNDIFASPSSSSGSDDQNHNNNNEKRKFARHEESGEDNAQSGSNKKPKVIWNNALNSRFLDAITSIGLERAVPKKIIEVMNVPGLTRVNVASHLQKYRMFLRRVSNASANIDRNSRDKIFGYFATSDLALLPPSFVHNTQNPNLGDGSPISMMRTSSTAMTVSGANCRGTLQENNGANVYQNFAPCQSKYVGFSISSIKQLTESGQSSGSKAFAGEARNGNENLSNVGGGHDNENKGARLDGPGDNIINMRQFSDVSGSLVQASPHLDPSLGCDENESDMFDDLSWSPLIDISEFCHMLDSPLDVNNHEADIPSQVNYLNNQQMQNGFDNTVVSSGFYEGSSSNWMNNRVPILDQAANQQHVGAMSSLYESSTQVNDPFTLPLVINEPQQVHEVMANNNLNDQNMDNVNLNRDDQNLANCEPH